ncbi:hypothetical protein GCM10027167_13760 [Nocardia heshunensis]
MHASGETGSAPAVPAPRAGMPSASVAAIAIPSAPGPGPPSLVLGRCVGRDIDTPWVWLRAVVRVRRTLSRPITPAMPNANIVVLPAGWHRLGGVGRDTLRSRGWDQ